MINLQIFNCFNYAGKIEHAIVTPSGIIKIEYKKLVSAPLASNENNLGSFGAKCYVYTKQFNINTVFPSCFYLQQ